MANEIREVLNDFFDENYIPDLLTITVDKLERDIESAAFTIVRKFMTYGGTHATLEESERKGETIFMIDYKGLQEYLKKG